MAKREQTSINQGWVEAPAELLSKVYYDKDLWSSKFNPFPYATSGSSGFDIRGYFEDVEGFTLHPNKSVMVSTHLRLVIPTGLELQIRSRSGLSFNNRIVVLNSPGTIDSDYRDEIKVILHNHGPYTYHFANGDRIAQGVFAPVVVPQFEAVADTANSELFKATSRKGGFGHSGIK